MGGGVSLDTYDIVRRRLHQHRIAAADSAEQALNELRQMMEAFAADLNIGGRDNASMDTFPAVSALAEDISGLHRLLSRLVDRIRTTV